jgi:hypothetical protein
VEKVNGYIRSQFETGRFEKREWVHDECSKPIVTYTDPRSGLGYKYFKDEDLTGTPAIVHLGDLILEGWEDPSTKQLDAGDQVVVES